MSYLMYSRVRLFLFKEVTMTKEWKNRLTQDVLILLGMLMALTFICRLWPILLLMILTLFIVMIRMLILTQKRQEDTVFEPVPETLLQEPERSSLIDIAYSEILCRITQLVACDFPAAKWVWENPDAKKRIENGDEVFIRLNRAGGYRRAMVQIHNLQVAGISYQMMELAEYEEDKEETVSEAKESRSFPEQENYELLAFEWVDARIIEINEKCNDAIADDAEYILLTEAELPVKDSWPAVCEELYRQNVVQTERLEEGIRIYLTERE